MSNISINTLNFDSLIVMKLYGSIQGDRERDERTIGRGQIPHDIQDEAENLIKQHDPGSAAKAKAMGHNNEIYVDPKTGKVWLRGVRGKGKRVVTNVPEHILPDHVRKALPRKRISFATSLSAYDALRRVATGALIPENTISRHIRNILETMNDPENKEHHGIRIVTHHELISLASRSIPMSERVLSDRERTSRFDIHKVHFLNEPDLCRVMVHTATKGDEAILTIIVDDQYGDFEFYL